MTRGGPCRAGGKNAAQIGFTLVYAAAFAKMAQGASALPPNSFTRAAWVLAVDALKCSVCALFGVEAGAFAPIVKDAADLAFDPPPMWASAADARRDVERLSSALAAYGVAREAVVQLLARQADAAGGGGGGAGAGGDS